MDSAEAKMLIARLQSNWPQRGYADERGELTSHGRRIAEVLSKFFFRDAEPAIQRLMDTGLFPPSPAELRRECEDQRSARLSAESDALPARGTWTKEDEEASMKGLSDALKTWRERHPAPTKGGPAGGT